ncbi:MAG: DoxX family protein [bacterium]
MNREQERFRSVGVFLLRAALGAYYLMHAYYVGYVVGIGPMAQFNASHGIPFPATVAWFILLGHGLGGAMLLAGYYTRLGALVNLVIVSGAVIFVHRTQGFFMTGIIINAKQGQAITGGYEFTLLLAIATLVVLFLGSGPLARKSAKPSRISLD